MRTLVQCQAHIYLYIYMCGVRSLKGGEMPHRFKEGDRVVVREKGPWDVWPGFVGQGGEVVKTLSSKDWLYWVKLVGGRTVCFPVGQLKGGRDDA